MPMLQMMRVPRFGNLCGRSSAVKSPRTPTDVVPRAEVLPWCPRTPQPRVFKAEGSTKRASKRSLGIPIDDETSLPEDLYLELLRAGELAGDRGQHRYVDAGDDSLGSNGSTAESMQSSRGSRRPRLVRNDSRDDFGLACTK